MATPAKQPSLTQIGKEDLKRFVVQSALLCLIDPVRGEPTRSLLDENPDGDYTSGGQKLKQKFLDAFALICSTSSSGAETASAVCLEQHVPAGATLRVARNRGLATKDLADLKTVLQILQATARKERTWLQAEAEILGVVVGLDRARICSLAEKLEKHGIKKFLQGAHSRLLAGRVKLEPSTVRELRLLLERCPFQGPSPQSWGPATLGVLISWASQARWVYPGQLRLLLGLADTENPLWLDSLHKIARYHSSIKSMVKLAAKQPEVFLGISIKAVQHSPPRQFSLSKEKAPLLSNIENLVKDDWEMTLEKLKRHLGTQDLEGRLRKTCHNLTLTLHAEMQLVLFYEGNPNLTPRLKFMGTSKKACFHCHEYLSHHPLWLQVSACHQKIYPSWMPPPFYAIHGKFQMNPPFVKVANKLEHLVKEELGGALNGTRRPKNYDSTAGPSLTKTATATGPTVMG
ncbi:hypothetical protein B0T14DRAFT_432595 [Immersiella caudata]|uniref:Uncharacterized protein n=1 Tax=Immersiella caudata TaxID=314043 RepID=A0AA39WNW2_9PEZI|nr:hypothetical protein B0T14DRAFT_432595 [Immersiella caudata]